MELRPLRKTAGAAALAASLIVLGDQAALYARGHGGGGGGGRGGGSDQQQQPQQQQDNEGDGQPQSPSPPPQPEQSPPREEPGPHDLPLPEPPQTTTLADAAENFPALVETYLARKSVKGVWPYTEKGRTARLTLVGVDTASVHSVGGRKYAGLATMRDARTQRQRRFLFTADMSGPKWKIVGARPCSTTASCRGRSAP